MTFTENTPLERLYNGIVKENPTLVIVLGMCPTLAVTTSAMNGIGMGLSTTVVLCLANLFISLLRNVIPDDIRIPSFIVIIASFVTMVDMLMQAFTPGLYKSLGIYIPLIVVNCIIFGRAEAYAYKNKPLASFFDGIGMGLGFTASITVMGFIRELIGSGAVFGHPIGALPEYAPAIFVMAPGAFLVLAIMITIRAYIINRIEEKNGIRLPVTHTDEEGSECSSCAMRSSCAGKFIKVEEMIAEEKERKAAAASAAKPAPAPVKEPEPAPAPEPVEVVKEEAPAPEPEKAEEAAPAVEAEPETTAEPETAEEPEAEPEAEPEPEVSEPETEEAAEEAEAEPEEEPAEETESEPEEKPMSALERLKAMKTAEESRKED